MNHLKGKEILRVRQDRTKFHIASLDATGEGLVLAVGGLVSDVPGPRSVCVYSQSLPEIGRRVKALR